MATKIQIVMATHDHARVLAPRLRPEDKEESRWIACSETPLGSLFRSLDGSRYRRAAIVNGRVMAMWGVHELESPYGNSYVWMVAAVGIDRYALSMLRHARLSMIQMRRLYPRLYTFVSASRPQAIRFARALGLEIGDRPYLANPSGDQLYIAETQGA